VKNVNWLYPFETKNKMVKKRAPRNRTLTVTAEEKQQLLQQLEKQAPLPNFGQDSLSSNFSDLPNRSDLPNLPDHSVLQPEQIQNRILLGDLNLWLECLPHNSVDLMIIDPPYNLAKNFNGMKFNRLGDEAYLEYLEEWFPRLLPLLKPDASVYLCGDWKCTSALYRIADKYLTVRNRISWQREKGRGAKSNWKNCTEDIWFATAGKDYYFDVDAVKVRRRVLAPYKESGKPKDWEETSAGKFRSTFPSNFWDDITVPYWSMPENTDHPTQKPEKLIAKLILASCPPGGLVFDPFMGSGTSAVVARKLGRHYCGVEINEDYCCWAQKRLNLAESDAKIQGYADGVFWERNSNP